MSTEHEHSAETNQDQQALQGNPAHWQGGGKFQVVLRETEHDGTPELSLQVFDGKEVVEVQFLGSVREARTLFLPAEQVPPPPADTSPLPAPTQEIASPVAPAPMVEVEKKPAN